jgi:hypothetical protein
VHITTDEHSGTDSVLWAKARANSLQLAISANDADITIARYLTSSSFARYVHPTPMNIGVPSFYISPSEPVLIFHILTTLHVDCNSTQLFRYSVTFYATVVLWIVVKMPTQ